MNISFSATGTLWQIDIYDDNLPDQDQLTKELTDFVEDFESNFSRFRDTSFVTSLAKKEGSYETPVTAKKLLDFYDNLYQLTDGLFTPTIGKSLISAGYDNSYSLVPQDTLATPDDWKNISYNQNSITGKKPTQLDFGGAGKGYIIDLVTNLLKK
jgi:thiamine biosynthesis lipoprotein